MKSYKMFSFLEPWYSEQLVGDTVIIWFGDQGEKNCVRLAPVKLDLNKDPEELTLDSNPNNSNKNVLEIYEDLGLTKVDYNQKLEQRKDSLGFMPYTIIGKTPNGEMLSVKRRSTIYQKELFVPENKIFRVVLNSTIH
ncbi:MAG: hypothetical protein AB7S50_15395 [Bacteroidales bacterium]